MRDSKFSGVLSTITVALIWGGSFVAAKIALETLSPLLLATVRFVIASILFTPLILRDMRRERIDVGRDLPKLLLLGLLGITLYFWLQYTGVKYAGAGISALIVVGFIPVMTGIVSSIILKEPFTKVRLAGVLLGFSGVALIVMQRVHLEVKGALFLLGAGSLLMNAVCWAIYSTLSREFLLNERLSPSSLTAYVTILGTLALIPLSATSDWLAITHLSLTQWLSILYLSVFCSWISYFLWNYALSRIEAVKAATWLYLEPVVAIIGSALLINEVPTIQTIIGGMIIITGAYITTKF